MLRAVTPAQTYIRSVPGVLTVLILVLYVALALVQTGESFVIDEMEFPRLAEAVADTGRPVYYRGDESPSHVGVFHPPLYAYALGGWLGIFGFSEVAARVFGVLLMLLTAWLGVRIVQLLDLAGRWGPPGFLALFLLHPYVIQSALLPDIDGTVLLFATVLLFYEVTRVARLDGETRTSVLRLSLAMALVLATKLTSIIVIPAVFVGILLAKGPRKALLLTAGSALAGSAIFLIVWWAVSALTDLPFAFPFEFTIQSGLKGGVSQTSVGELFRRLVPAPWTTFWLGVLPPTMAAVGTAILITQWRSHPERRMALMFSMWTFGVLAFYSVISGPPFGFPKYFIAAMPTMAIVGVVTIDLLLRPSKEQTPAVFWAALTVFGLALLAGWEFARSRAEGPYSWPGIAWTLGLIVLAALAMSLIARDRSTWLVALPLGALILATLSYNVGMAAVQAADERSVRYYPGEVGFDETVERLQSLTGPDEPILVPKDIGSATYNRYHEQEQLFLDLDRLEDVLADDEVSYAVVRTNGDYSYQIFPQVEPIIEAEMDLLEQVGDFLIYERSPDG
jgi:hypothetical protein